MTASKAKPQGEPTPVFGLTRARLRPIVENIAGEPLARFDVRIEHQVQGHYGYGAEKLIPTFTYTTRSGRTGRQVVFVKWFGEPGPHEAHHYAWLAKHQAPIPRMYGALTGPGQREMIVLEYLQRIEDLHPFHRFMNDAARFPQFLALAAHFNAIRPSDERAAQLPRRDVAARLTGALPALERIWAHACKGELGEAMARLCSSRRDKLSQVRRMAQRLAEPIARMQTGLAHNDFYPDSAGRRRQTGELLAVDLESVGLAPRFYDAARWLGAPDGVQPRCRPRRELARYYLQQYARWGGRAVPMGQFLAEARILWTAQTLEMLWFSLRRALDGEVDWTEDRAEGRRVYRQNLHEKLTGLLDQARRQS